MSFWDDYPPLKPVAHHICVAGVPTELVQGSKYICEVCGTIWILMYGLVIDDKATGWTWIKNRRVEERRSG